MSEAAAVLHVSGNTPRLLEEGTPAPPPPQQLQPDLPPAPPAVYWTPDKAQQVVAQLCRAGSKFYGPHFKAAEWELDLIGDPAAAVLNDWLPLKVGEGGDKTANLIALGAVLGIILLLRLPDILEVHGILKPWKPPAERAAEKAATPEQPAAATPQAPPTATVYEPQMVGDSGRPAGGDSKVVDVVFGAQQVGSGGGFVGG